MALWPEGRPRWGRSVGSGSRCLAGWGVVRRTEAARRQLAERHRELTERDHQLATRDHRLAEQERQLAEVRGRLAQREEELAAISATLGWRILTEYRRVARSSKILSITHAALTAQLKRWMRRG